MTNIYYFVPGTIAHPSDEVEREEDEDSGANQAKEIHFYGKDFNKLVVEQNNEHTVEKVVIHVKQTKH